MYAREHMKGGGGVIINHTSSLGLAVEANMTSYSAASAGFIAASRAFSVSHINHTFILSYQVTRIEPKFKKITGPVKYNIHIINYLYLSTHFSLF